MILKKAMISSPSISYREVIFPSGKKVVFGLDCYEYIPKNQEELRFLSGLMGIQIVDMDDTEARHILEALPEPPSVDRTLSQDEVERYVCTKENEEALMDMLIKAGYFDANKISGSTEVSSAISRISDAAIIKEFVKRYKANPNVGKAASIELQDVVYGEINSLSEEELKQVLSKMGYGGLRKLKGE